MINDILCGKDKESFWGLWISTEKAGELLSFVSNFISVWTITLTLPVDKTWYSVSNSRLSKTFVLGSLQNLKFRTSVSSLQRSFSLKFILGQTKFGVWTNFGFQKNVGKKKTLCLKKFRSQKVFGQKNILGPKKFWVWKKFWDQKNFGSKKKFGSEKFGSQKNVWPKRTLRLKKF